MIFGVSLATDTAVHVAISLIGIGSGFVVLLGLMKGKPSAVGPDYFWPPRRLPALPASAFRWRGSCLRMVWASSR